MIATPLCSRIIAASLCLALPTPAIADPPSFISCGNFARSQDPDSSVDANLIPSVLRLTVTDPQLTVTGTGYLIDSEQGYVLTAEHVVHLAAASKSASITATSPGLPGVTLKFRLVDSIEDQWTDMALLQAQPIDALNSLTPFDITLHPPQRGNLRSIGYPKLPPELKDDAGIPNAKPVSLSAPDYKRGLMITTQAEFEGVSGSPLIDSEGAVVGTCKDMIGGKPDFGGNRGIYIMLLKARTLLLKNIGMTSRIRGFDDSLRQGNVSIEQAIYQFTPAKKHFSNLELLSLAWRAYNMPAAYKEYHSIFNCLLSAFGDRGLFEAQYLIKDLADEATQAHSLIRSGQLAENEGRLTDAQASYAAALTPLRLAINKRIANNPNEIEAVACKSQEAAKRLQALGADGKTWLRLPASITAGLPPPCFTSPQTDPSLGYLFQDYSILALSIADTDRPKRNQWLRDATTTASLSALTHTQPAQKATAYKLLGDALQKQNNAKDAVSAYSKSWNLLRQSGIPTIDPLALGLVEANRAEPLELLWINPMKGSS